MGESLRKYIILDNKYSREKTKEKGHCKIDKKKNKTILNVNVENFQDNSIFDIIILKDVKTLDKERIARIITDLKGRGQAQISLNDRQLDIFNQEALIIEKENVFVIGGYINDSKIIPQYIQALKALESQPKEDYREESVEELPQDPIEEMEDIVIEEDIPQDIIVEEETPHIGEEILIDEEYHGKIIEEDNLEEVIIEEDKYEEKIIQEEKEEDKMLEYVLSVLKYFPKIEPTKISLQGYSWWKIDSTEENKGFLPYYNYLMGGNIRYKHIGNSTSSRYLINKYGYYLFGIYREDSVKYYMYGVPGQFVTRDHPYMGLTGYNTWFEGKGDYGYWVIYIDPISSSPIYTINPMQPDY